MGQASGAGRDHSFCQCSANAHNSAPSQGERKVLRGIRRTPCPSSACIVPNCVLSQMLPGLLRIRFTRESSPVKLALVMTVFITRRAPPAADARDIQMLSFCFRLPCPAQPALACPSLPNQAGAHLPRHLLLSSPYHQCGWCTSRCNLQEQANRWHCVIARRPCKALRCWCMQAPC